MQLIDVNRKWPALAAILWLALPVGMRAQTYSSRADKAGCTVYATSGGTNAVGWDGANYAPRVGEYYSHGAVLVLPFQLPTLPAGAQFAAADFRVWLFDVVGQTNVPFAADLYALPARATNAVLATDFYAKGTPDTNAILLQARYLVPGMTNGHGSSANAPAIITSAAADTNLVSFLNDQYRSGAGAGSWIFFRLSPATNSFNDNYAYSPMTSMAGETWAWPMLEYTTTANTNIPPVQTNNQTISIIFPVQGMAYAKLDVAPAPLSVSPTPPEGITSPSVRNPTSPVTYQYTFPPNTSVTVSKNQFTGSDPNSDIRLNTVDWTGATQAGQSVTTLALDGAVWNVQVYSVSNTNTNAISGLIPDPYPIVPPVPVSGGFGLVSPADGAMITSTRRPSLNWSPAAGAVKYDVYINLSLTNYDWMAPGSLLDRFTQVATVTNGTGYTLERDLSDRWTYKWYVVATDSFGGTNRSDLGMFSLYLPNVTAIQDGITNINGMRDLNKDGVIEPYEDWHNPAAVRVADLMSRMTLHEKAMQLFWNAQVYPDAGWAFGPFQAADLFAYQKAATTNRLGIPFLSAGDTIHGFKTTFPTQPGLAATRDLQITWAVADVQRRESVAVGYRGTLSPLAEVGTKMLYPRIQEGCGEDADLAAGIVRAMVVGLQGGPEINPHSIMITTKHWCGQGAGGEAGVVYDGTTIHYHMRPWHAAIEAGTSCIMPGYAGCQLLGPQGGGAGDNPSILAYLRNNLGYTNLICTDWLPSGDWTNAAIAGSDVMGGADPAAMGNFENVVPQSRIDDAVRRVLDLKFRMGIFEDPYDDNVAGTAAWHTPENVAIVHRAAVESITLLKNNGALPLRWPAGSSIVVTGPRANDPSCMVTWRSDFHNNDFDSQTIYQAIVTRAAQDGITVYTNAASAGTNPISAAIVVVGESYYTHGTFWDDASPWLPDDPIGPAHDTNDAPQFSLIQYFHSNNIPTTTICLLPRPDVLANVVAQSDAFMVVYRPGDEGGPAIAEILWGDKQPSGKTPWQLPLSMSQVGDNIQANWASEPDHWDLPFDFGATAAELASIRTNIALGLPVPPTTGNPLFHYGAGMQGFGLVDATSPQAFDLLSPNNGQIITSALPPFTWQAATDPETGIQRYEVYIDNTLVTTTTKQTSYVLSGATMGNGAHSWYVKAYNWAGGTTASPTNTFTINDTVPPAAFRACLPPSGTVVNSPATVTFYWEQSTDAGTGLAGYALLIDGNSVATMQPDPIVPPSENLALDKAAWASSTHDGTPSQAIDGNPATRWGSDWTTVTNADTEWWAVDLGAIYSIKEVVIKWENAYGKEFYIQTSPDGSTWTSIYHMVNGTGGTNDITNLSGAGRYVKMQGVKRGSGYGYSFWEFQVYGIGTEQATVAVPDGTHAWQVRAFDGAGNASLNGNGPYSITSLTGFQQWQIQYFGSTNNPAAAPAADADGTGQNNHFKYIAGLNPTNPASVFTLRLDLNNSLANLRFGPVISNRLYTLEGSTNLSAGPWSALAVGNPPTNCPQMILTDTKSATATRFYRLNISMP